MKGNTDRRTLLFRISLALFACGGAVFFSPNLVQSTLAQESTVTCTATCKNGSCTGNKEYCVCACGWFGSAECNCSSAPKETTPTSPTPTPTV